MKYVVELTLPEARALVSGAARVESEYDDRDVTWHEAQAAKRARLKIVRAVRGAL